jgi:hypothetical protein
MFSGSLLAPMQLFGYVALVFGVTAFLQKNDTRLKVLVAAESVAYMVHFLLLGNYPASGSALVSCLRNVTSVKSRSAAWIAVYLIAGLAIGVIFTRSAAGWLPVIASCLATVAIFRMSGIALRIALLICTLLWLVNNILSGSVGGTVLETIIALANLSTIIRLAAGRREHSA